MYLSTEEIKFYYELMLQQIDNQKIDNEEKTIEDEKWQKSTYKHIFEEVKDIH